MTEQEELEYLQLLALQENEAAPVAAAEPTVGRPIEAGLSAVAETVPGVGSYLNNLSAGAARAMVKAEDLIRGTNLADNPAFDYVKIRDELNKDTKKLKAENPTASGIGTGTGILAQLPISVGAMGAAKAAPFFARLARAAGIGATGAAIANPGDVEGEVGALQGKERLQNALLGAAIAGGGEGILSGVKKGSELLAPKLKSTAGNFAFSGLRGYKKDVKIPLLRGQKAAIGREALDSGTIGNIPRSASTLAARAEEKAAEQSAKYGKLLNELDPTAGPTAVTRAPIAATAEQELLMELGIPGATANNKQLEKLLNEFKLGKDMSLSTAQNLKNQIKKAAKFDKYTNPSDVAPIGVEVNRNLYRALNKEIDAAADKVATDPGALKGVRETLSNRKAIENITQGRAIGDEVNRIVSPTDYGSAATGLLSQGPIGLTLGVLNNLARRFGGQVTGKQLDNAYRLLDKANRNLSDRPIAPIQDFLLGQLASQAKE